MAQVSTIALTNINNSAHFLFLKDIVDRASNDSNITKNCAAQVEALQKAVQEEDACSNISNKSLATDKIAEADRLRDKLYLGYKRSVSAYLDFPDADCANAAKILNQHIIDYNINVLDQLHKETGALVGFIKDLETIHKNLVETLNLTRFVDHLKAANGTYVKDGATFDTRRSHLLAAKADIDHVEALLDVLSEVQQPSVCVAAIAEAIDKERGLISGVMRRDSHAFAKARQERGAN